MDNVKLNEMINWINENEFFWLEDFRKKFNIPTEHKKDKELYSMYNHLISYLKKYNFIQCCERKGSYSQYMRIKIIILPNLKLGKNN